MASTTPTTRSQSELAYERVRELLVSLELPPGAPLPEAELMERVDVGRTPLREALQRLAAERLVVIHPRRGTFATDINIADLASLTELRAGLEGLVAELAAARATEADRATLADLVGRAVDATDHEVAMRQDTAVHEALWAAAHNRFLAETAARYHGLSMRIWHLYVDRLQGLSDHVDEHAAILDAIAAGDEQAAGGLAVAHVRGFEAAVRALW